MFIDYRHNIWESASRFTKIVRTWQLYLAIPETKDFGVLTPANESTKSWEEELNSFLNESHEQSIYKPKSRLHKRRNSLVVRRYLKADLIADPQRDVPFYVVLTERQEEALSLILVRDATLSLANGHLAGHGPDYSFLSQYLWQEQKLVQRYSTQLERENVAARKNFQTLASVE